MSRRRCITMSRVSKKNCNTIWGDESVVIQLGGESSVRQAPLPRSNFPKPSCSKNRELASPVARAGIFAVGARNFFFEPRGFCMKGGAV
jgi:hypothetical protein